MKRKRREYEQAAEPVSPIFYARPVPAEQYTERDKKLFTIHDIAQEYVQFIKSQKTAYKEGPGKAVSIVQSPEGELIRTHGRELLQKMRSPLSVLHNFIQLIGSGKLKSKVSQSLIVSSEYELITLENILAYLLLSWKPSFHTVVININTIIQQELTNIFHRFRNKKIAVRSEFSDIPAAPCSVELFSLCVRNILYNILEASPENTEAVITTRKAAEPYHELIFITFTNQYLLDTTEEMYVSAELSLFHTTKDSHVGIGLPVCQAIMSSMSGTISLNTIEPNTFETTLILPVGAEHSRNG